MDKMHLRPWNEVGQAWIDDPDGHRKCACGIMTTRRLRIPYSKRVYVVCNQCKRDITN